MKAIILVLFVLFSFSNVSAQKTTATSNYVTSKVVNSIDINKEMITKADFYNALIKANKFDIKIKNTTIAKSGYYNRLLIKNGFRLKIRKSSSLAYNNIKEVSLLHNYYTN